MGKHRPAKQPNRKPETPELKYSKLGEVTSQQMKQENRIRFQQRMLRRATRRET